MTKTVVLILLALLTVASAGGAAPRPNIVLVTIDALRADHLSVYGYGRRTSPELEKLAGAGVVFENAYAQSDWTLPSLSSLTTGLEPGRHGAVTPRCVLDWRLPNMPGKLAEAGYATACFATSYYHEQRYGLQRGYQTYLGESGARTDAEDLTSAALKWLSDHRGGPFFLRVHYYDPHAPYAPRSPWYSLFHPQPYLGHLDFANSPDPNAVSPPGAELSPGELARLVALYDSEIAFTDRALGRLLGAVSLENTFVCVSADHGEAFKEHGGLGHGIALNRELIHVPLICAGVGVSSKNERLPQTVQLLDLFPTVLEMAGLPSEPKLIGRSLACLLSGGPPPEQAVAFAEQSESSEFVTYYSAVAPPFHLVRQYRKSDGVMQGQQFYDWRCDPTEQQDVFSDAEPTCVNLATALDRYVTHVGGPNVRLNANAPMDSGREKELRSLGYLAGP